MVVFTKFHSYFWSQIPFPELAERWNHHYHIIKVSLIFSFICNHTTDHFTFTYWKKRALVFNIAAEGSQGCPREDLTQSSTDLSLCNKEFKKKTDAGKWKWFVENEITHLRGKFR